MSDGVSLLQELGFSEYEARAYVALLQHNSVSGYQLAKVSGIPRANIYLVLQKLEERGAVVRTEGDDGTRYLFVAPEEFLEAVAHRFGQTVHTAQQTLQALRPSTPDGYVWHIQGYDNLLAHARAVIKEASSQLLVALWPEEARVLADDFSAADARKVEITTLCMAACAEECGGCRGRVFRNKVLDTEESRWLLLVPDQTMVLAGEIAPGRVSTVRSSQELLIHMTAWFVRHSIALATMLQGLGAQLEAQLPPATQTILADLGPTGSSGWLAYMRGLLSATADTDRPEDPLPDRS